MSVTREGGRKALAGRAGRAGPVRPYGPGDLARRVSGRRAELGLTRPQLAAKARLGLPYLEYLEESTARPAPAVLRRLAAALQTTPAALLGAGLDVPPGRGRVASRRPDLQTLTPEECYELLAPGGIGRVAFSTKGGPVVLPVNFAMAGHTVVFLTGAASVRPTSMTMSPSRSIASTRRSARAGACCWPAPRTRSPTQASGVIWTAR
jgi:transcriptional regulator with XRE-family HTH domain